MAAVNIQFDPNLVDESKSLEILVPATILTILIVSSTTTRLLTKLYLRRRLGIEDYFIIVGLVS